jgi:hypothetical protein
MILETAFDNHQFIEYEISLNRNLRCQGRAEARVETGGKKVPAFFSNGTSG